jgi:hypothetical protein
MKRTIATRGLSAVDAAEKACAYQLTKLYRVEQAARRLVQVGKRCGWSPCADLAGARLALEAALDHVAGWSDRFFNSEVNDG